MPQLSWPGKFDTAGERAALPRPGATLEARELFDGAEASAGLDRIIGGDNLLAMDALLREHAGAIDLVYIDPPFSTGGKFSVATRVGGSRNGKAPPEVEAPAYTDRFEGGVDGFLAAMDPRLRMLHALLAPHGSLYLHCDPTVGHAAKLLLDEIFGPECFQREIVWRIGWISGFKSKARNWIRNHDLIFFYVKDPKRFTFNKIYVPYPEGYTRRDGSPPKGKGMPIDDVWNANDTEFSLRGAASLDSIQIKSFSTEKCGYATQKNESIAQRIIEASSNPGDLVVDVFCGSGTAGVAARRLGRRFIGCDCSAAAVHIAKKRLLDVASPRGVAVQRVGAPGSMDAWVPTVLAHRGATDEGAGWGATGDAGVFVAGAADAPDPPRIERWLAEARARGHARLEVLSRRFSLPLTYRSPPDVVLVRVVDDVLNPAVASEAGAALVEIPDIGVEACRVDDGVALALTHYGFAHPERCAEKLRAAVTTWSDLIDAWSVTWQPEPLLRVRTDAIEFRTHQRRELRLQTDPRALPRDGLRAVVKIVDVLYQSTAVELTIVADGDAVAIADARRI